MMKSKLWIVYDARATPGTDTDDATVFSSASSLKGARRDARETGMTCAIWEYDIAADGVELINERFVEMR